MTPLQIMMMLHYYSAIAAPYARDDLSHAESTAVVAQRQQLIGLDMLAEDECAKAGYRVTERGAAYVEALCAVQLPIKKWVVLKKA